MPTRIVYHVLPSPRGGWSVRRGRSARASRAVTAKAAAVRAAVALAKGHPLSQVVIHNADGTIASDRLYYGKPLARGRKARASAAKAKRTIARTRAKRRSIGRKAAATRKRRAHATAVKRSRAAKRGASTRRRG